MIVLAGGDIVLPDRVIPSGSLIIDAGRIAAIESRPSVDPGGARLVNVAGAYVVPGFIDVHVHGIEGIDTLDSDGEPVARIAAKLPQYGVTAFCPTTVACGPEALRGVLSQVASARHVRAPRSARVLTAHLESNFINPDYKGAQPSACLRTPGLVARVDGDFTAGDILTVIAAMRSAVGVVTLAPELPGGIDLVRTLVAAGHRVSLGHSGADYDTAIAAIEAGARHATHLFNRMTPVTHRAPGLAGAVLARQEVAAELICDGHHVHPAMGRVALAAKGTHGIMAITDGTGGAGLPIGATARLGGQTIHVREHAAVLDDGTLAGSTLTMDRAFRNVVTMYQRSVVDAALVCSTTPARELGLTGLGAIAKDATADLVVLNREFNVLYTLIDGALAFEASA